MPWRTKSSFPGQTRLPLPIEWCAGDVSWTLEAYPASAAANFSLPPSHGHWLTISREGGALDLEAQVGTRFAAFPGVVGPDSVFFIPAWMKSHWRYRASHGCYHLRLCDAWLLSAMRACGIVSTRLSDLRPLVGEGAADLVRPLRRFVAQAQEVRPNREALKALGNQHLPHIAKLLVQHCFSAGSVEDDGRRLPPEVFARLSELVHADYHRPITLDELAEVAGMNRFSLSRRFKLGVGRSPTEYVNLVRVCRVRAEMHLPLERRLPMAELALQAGFTDQSHMIRVFKQFTGMTPGKYREAAGE